MHFWRLVCLLSSPRRVHLFLDTEVTAVLLSIIIALPVFHAFGLYRVIFRYSRLPALLTVSKATAIYGYCMLVLLLLLGLLKARTIGIIQPTVLLLTVQLHGSLLVHGLINWVRCFNQFSRQRVMIYGAGVLDDN